MTRTILVSIALAGIVACGRAKQEIAGDDSGGRNLERTPSAGGSTLSDRLVSFTSTTRTLGAGGGAVVAVETASRDVVVRAGAPVVITLTGPLTVSTQ